MMYPTKDRNYLLVLAALFRMDPDYGMGQALDDYDFTVEYGIVWC